MANGEISRDTFSRMDQDSKLNVLFDYALNSHKCACDTRDQLDALKTKVERRKKIDSSLAVGAGFAGGIFAHIAEKWGLGR